MIDQHHLKPLWSLRLFKSLMRPHRPKLWRSRNWAEKTTCGKNQQQADVENTWDWKFLSLSKMPVYCNVKSAIKQITCTQASITKVLFVALRLSRVHLWEITIYILKIITFLYLYNLTSVSNCSVFINNPQPFLKAKPFSGDFYMKRKIFIANSILDEDCKAQSLLAA